MLRVEHVDESQRLRSRRKWWPTTTVRDPTARPAPDLVARASGPDQLWVADLTYVPIGAGSRPLAVVLDV